MSRKTVTLALNGDVPLGAFSDALRHLTALLDSLTRDIAKGTPIEWVIDDLQAGSALTTALGIAEDEYALDQVIEGYIVVGEALEQGRPIPYSRRVQRAAAGITGILDGKVTSIRFETEQRDATIVSPAEQGKRSPTMRFAYGTVKGTVQTLTSRHGLRFTLYDALFDKAVSCYLQPGYEETMRDVWGRRVVVSGRVGRDPVHGRAVIVRGIKRIDQIPDAETGSYRRARGIIPYHQGMELPEVTIRRLRDAERA